ncbi:MAG: glycosyltransferase family 2 protein [Deltaproteobacteria bacterium]|nr:glycosyltransferase family 2 protein [Deltaproteobacteria bacterium]
MKSVSIIIPTKNGGMLFEEVLQGIRGQRFEGEVELIAVDSGSTDGTVKKAGEYGARVLEIPPGEFNHGLTRNYGIENSKGDFIVLMTQDAVPADESWLKNLVDTFDNDERIAGVYARQIPRDDADVLTKRNLNGWLTGRNAYSVQEIKDRESLEKMPPMEKYLTCVFDNVCSAVRRKAWEKVPFKHNDFGEDIEWAKRALQTGWKIAYQPKAAVVHSHNRSVAYEYRRTYMCHRKLYELFNLRTVPSRADLLRNMFFGSISDLRYVFKNERSVTGKLGLSMKIPLLVSASVLAQYRGAKDEKLSTGVKKKGV